MKWWVYSAVILSLVTAAWWQLRLKEVEISPQGEVRVELPYAKYSFKRLAERGGVASPIEINENMFYYVSEGRKISGLVVKPEGESRGIVIMARGYVDKEIYETGVGTRKAASYYASQGYTVYAPDFSGYGESDPEDENPMGARLVKPVEILDLIASVDGDEPIYLWGHSNGGQIMLSVAEILGKRSDSRVKGLTLWAPVTKPFPYSILYYTDEAEDQGKYLRKLIAKFEQDYDVFDYSLDHYWDWIQMPLLLHQGTADEAVPHKWSTELAKQLSDKEKNVVYQLHPGTDHNMVPVWDNVVKSDVTFFQNLK